MRTISKLALLAVVLTGTGCLEFPSNGRYRCDPDTGADCGEGDGVFTVTSLSDAYVSIRYESPALVEAGMALTVIEGALPPGLVLSSDGRIVGTPSGDASAQGRQHTFTLAAVDSKQQQVTRGFTLTTWLLPALEGVALPPAMIGVSYRGEGGEAVKLGGINGRAPLSFTVTAGLPPGLSASQDGTLSGVPTGPERNHVLSVTVRDANGTSASGEVSLDVRPLSPIPGGGMAGGPITDNLTVLVTHESGARVPNAAVRLRLNGQELDPPREAVTDADGVARFENLGLDGTTDTVDLTVSGHGLLNVTLLKVNAALVTVRALIYPEPFPRTATAAAVDPIGGELTVFGGFVSTGTAPVGTGEVCSNSIAALTNATGGEWTELLPDALQSSPAPRAHAGMAALDSKLYLFGGLDCRTRIARGDLWRFDSTSKKWNQVVVPCQTCARPPPRSEFAMFADSSRIWVVGGLGDNGLPLSDAWTYDVATNAWTSAGNLPTGLIGAGGVALSTGGLVCGGSDGVTLTSGCWQYSGAAAGWVQVGNFPFAVRGLKLAFRPIDQQLYAFGGMSDTGPNSAVYRRGLSQPTFFAVPHGGTAPNGGTDVVFAWDASSQLLVAANTADGATFTSDGSAWTRRSSGPLAGTRRVNGFLLGGGSMTLVGASSSSGWMRTVALNGTQGAFTLEGLPRDDDLMLTAVSFTNGAPSAIFDSGALPSGEVTPLISIQMQPPGSVGTLSTTLQPPPEWGTSWTSGAATFVHRKGFSAFAHMTGYSSSSTVADPSITFPNFPAADLTTRMMISGDASDPATCETSVHFIETELKTVALVPGVRSLTPGAPSCSPFNPPSASPQLFSFIAPPAPLEFEYALISFGPANGTQDWVVYMPVTNGQNTFVLPEPSRKVAGGRARVPDQAVQWRVILFGKDPNAETPFDWNRARFANPAAPFMSMSKAWQYLHTAQ